MKYQHNKKYLILIGGLLVAVLIIWNWSELQCRYYQISGQTSKELAILNRSDRKRKRADQLRAWVRHDYLDCDSSTIALIQADGQVVIIGGNKDMMEERPGWKGESLFVNNATIQILTEEGKFESNDSFDFSEEAEKRIVQELLEEGGNPGVGLQNVFKTGREMEKLSGLDQILWCEYPFSCIAVKSDNELLIITEDGRSVCFQEDSDPVQAIVLNSSKVLLLNRDGSVTASEEWYEWSKKKSRFSSLCVVDGLVLGVNKWAKPELVWGTETALQASGYNCSGWSNIISLDSSLGVLLGLCSDGTVLVTGKREKEFQEVLQWRDIKEIAVSQEFAVGWKRNGCLVWTSNAEEKVEGLEAYQGRSFPYVK